MSTAQAGYTPPDYAQLRDDWARLCEIVKGSGNLDVADAAQKFRTIYDPQKGPIPWRNTTAPYLTEPMKMLTSRRHRGVILAAPAQCGKTEILINLAMHSAVVQPRDLLLFEKSQTAARDFSRRRIERSIDHSPEWKAQRTLKSSDDNMMDKIWLNGSILTLSYPTKNEFAGKPVPVQALTDYDRMPQDVDGEGSPFDLARKRGTTFGSSSMCFAESSPSFEVIDPSWSPKPGSHEAPPTLGILALYNRGDRRRWNVPCQHCGEYFEPTFDHLVWDDGEKNHMIAAKGVKLACSDCGGLHAQSNRSTMNRAGLWVPEGFFIDPKAQTLVGDGRVSDIASFWLPGPAAAFQSWEEMVMKYLQAVDEFDATGSEEALKSTVNTDQCKPYISMRRRNMRSAAQLEARAAEMKPKVVPKGVRYIVASVDVQINRFAVLVMGYGVGREKWIIDRYDLRFSPSRLDENDEPEGMDPSSYLEDWEALLPVIEASYPLESDPNKRMRVRLSICDSGGAAARIGTGSVTEKAYRFWRSLRTRSLSNKFQILKGEGGWTVGKTIRKTFPDNTGSTKGNSEAKGDVPVWMVKVNSIKDIVSNDLQREDEGPGYFHFPDWLPSAFYEELAVETRDPKQGWQNTTHKPNEAFDLCGYCHVAAVLIGAEKIDWSRPPQWARPQDENTSTIFDVTEAQKDGFNPAPRRKRRQISTGLR